VPAGRRHQRICRTKVADQRSVKCEAGKALFFEKKNPKLLSIWHRARANPMTAGIDLMMFILCS
jgi:hypothetical protein